MKARDVLTADQLARIISRPAPEVRPVPVTAPQRPKPVLRSVPDRRSPAMVWLAKKMESGPRRITDVIEEWTRGVQRELDGTPATKDAARLINELTAARTALGLESYEGEDGKFWWRPPDFLDDARD